MREPPHPTLDLSPYFRLLTRRPQPEKLSEEEIEKRLKKVERFTNNTKRYADTLAYALFFGFPAIGYGAMALGFAAPLLWAIGGSYAMFQGFKFVVKKAVLRAHSDVLCYTTELSNRAAARAVESEKELQRQAEAAAQRVKQAQEAFEKALDDGLPLQKKIAVSKSPLKLKPVTAAVKELFDAEALPQGPGPGSVTDVKVSAEKASSKQAGGPLSSFSRLRY
jgi:hypothetical protein